MPSLQIFLLFILLLVGVHAFNLPSLPPRARLLLNRESELGKMKKEVLSYCFQQQKQENKNTDINLYWEVDSTKGYQISTSIFRAMQQAQQKHCHKQQEDEKCVVCFPSITNKREETMITNLVEVLEENASTLNIDKVECVHYPKSPVSLVSLSLLCTSSTEKEGKANAALQVFSIKENTASWVNEFVSKYRLCPYTASVRNAAVGLTSVGVQPGPVSIIVVGDDDNENDTDDKNDIITNNNPNHAALNLVASFWSSVSFLLSSPETASSTILLVDPSYDDEFASFYKICDDIIEPTVVATESTEYIGRAWFHPLYDADIVGHEKVLPGHAIPHDLVRTFARKLEMNEKEEKKEQQAETLDREGIAKANDLVRRTPHATVNILRRSQLEAASQYEKNLPGKNRIPPNSIYVRNVKRLLSSSMPFESSSALERGEKDEGGEQ